MLHSCRRVPFLPKLYEELLRAPYDKHVAADIEADRIRNISMAAYPENDKGLHLSE